MSDESPGKAGSSDEGMHEPTRLDQLRTAEGKRKSARDELARMNGEIRGNKRQIDQLQREVREDESKLPEMRQNEQQATQQVRELLAELEKDYNLSIERVQASGSVAQGDTATFRAVHDELPADPKLIVSWNTGGCPFEEGTDDTITVKTSSVAPGDYDISVSLELAKDPSETSSRATVSTMA
jgi:TolA-binding protein